MRTRRTISSLLLGGMLFAGSCADDAEEFVICANRCTSAKPWRVESLDLGLPCFATSSECEKWKTDHAYSGVCVRCD